MKPLPHIDDHTRHILPVTEINGQLRLTVVKAVQNSTL